MNKDKQILDYREPFSAPYMIREIAKNVHLPFVVYAQDFTVATISFALTFSLLLFFFGMNQLVVMVSVAIPYGLVQLFNQLEPDGKRADIFLKDYLTFLFTFSFRKKLLYHEKLYTFKQDKVIYHRCLICQLTIKKREEELSVLEIDQLKEELKAMIIQELIDEFSSLNAPEQGFYELFETDDEVLFMKKILIQRYSNGMIPMPEYTKLKEHYHPLIKTSVRKRITRLL